MLTRLVPLSLLLTASVARAEDIYYSVGATGSTNTVESGFYEQGQRYTNAAAHVGTAIDDVNRISNEAQFDAYWSKVAAGTSMVGAAVDTGMGVASAFPGTPYGQIADGYQRVRDALDAGGSLHNGDGIGGVTSAGQVAGDHAAGRWASAGAAYDAYTKGDYADAVGNGVSAAGYGWAGDTIKGAGDFVDAYNAYYDADALAAQSAAYAAYAQQQMHAQQAWLLQQANAYHATGASFGARSTCSGICSGVAR